MQTINRLLINICAQDLSATKAFYTKLFDFEIAFDSDWFVQLVSKDKGLELGIIEANNDLVPQTVQGSVGGFYITFVVDDVEELYQLAQNEGLEISQKPTDTAYGQRQMILTDPNGVCVDISAPIKDFQF